MADNSPIRVLPESLVKKIAAGEVIERPASVVKELMENALDAGATRISLAIEQGGSGLIRVTDDGCGMSAEDLTLSVTPHATSKLASDDDLFAITTMGFRGEALASVSAVSKMRLVSRPKNSDQAHEIRIVEQKLERAQAAGAPCGTTVEVRDLFFNVPARRKFLRSASTETGHVNEQFARLALARPDVGFELNNNGRVTQNLPPCKSRVERIAKFYGAELAASLLHVHREERGVSLEAFLAPPAQSRSNTNWQYVYVNGRYVRDRFIQHAVREAFRGLVESNRHGVVFLFLAVPPDSLDVNVHPTKIEVRWADSHLIHSQVLSALRETFQRCDLTPSLNTDRAGVADPAEQQRMRAQFAEAMKSAVPIAAGGPQSGESRGTGPGIRDSDRLAPSTPPPAAVPNEVWRSLYGSASPATEPSITGSRLVEEGSPPTGESSANYGRAVQMHNLYLVAETPDGIVIIDQHALHERVMYEQLKARITKGPLEAQRLLLPDTVTVTPRQAALLAQNEDLLTTLGIEITPFGEDAVAVHTFPALLKDTDVAGFIRDLLDELSQQSPSTSTEQVIHKVLDMMACKAAVKAGDPLTREEIDALLRQKDMVDKSSNCPHGRPTMLRLTKADLDRQFKRT